MATRRGPSIEVQEDGISLKSAAKNPKFINFSTLPERGHFCGAVSYPLCRLPAPWSQ